MHNLCEEPVRRCPVREFKVLMVGKEVMFDLADDAAHTK